MSPAHTILERLGGRQAVAQHLNLDKSTLCRWCGPKPGGTDGLIPQRYWPGLVVLARKQGIDITVAELAGLKA
tara:strand:+ start:725 stop:943 length:219 start_codon:yes stop_codon:yes gene_type:complete